MTEDWKTTRFGDLYAEPSLNGLTVPSRMRGEGVRFVNMGEMFSYDFIADQPMELAPLPSKGSQRWLLRPGDLLFARQSLSLAGAGRCILVTGSSSPMTFESHIIRVRLDAEIADPRYLYYYFRSPSGRRNIESIVEQVAAAGIRSSDLRELTVPLPPIAEQRRIAALLGSLDELISSNGALVGPLRDLAITALTAAAAHGETARVGDVAEVRRGLSYKGSGLAETGIPMVNMGSAEDGGWLKRSGWKFYRGEYKARHVAHSGDLIVMNTEQTWRNEILGWPLLVPDDVSECLFTHHTYLVAFRDETAWLRLPLWAYLYSGEARAELTSKVQGSTVANLPIDAVSDLVFRSPRQGDPVLASAAEALAAAWDAEREVARLSAVRDELIPLLLTGRVSVREVAA
jgi:type I restriction enzyme, S subunit